MNDFTPPNHRRVKRMYRAQHAIWLWLGVAAVIACVAWFLDPVSEAARSPIGRELDHGLDDGWHILLALGGIVIFYGIWDLRPRAEVIGHLFISVSVTINALANILVIGWASSVFILIGIALASAFRIWFLLQAVPTAL